MQKLTLRPYIFIALFFILALAVFIGFIMPFQVKIIKKPVQTVPHPHRTAYKINLDSLEITYDKVVNNQNLSTLLYGFVPGTLIDQISKETNDKFDVRKIHAGNTFARISRRDSSHRLLYFIYEINPIDFVVYDLRDSLKIYRDKKKVTRLVKQASGTIETSLWNCFIKNRLDINLGMALSDVYAWTIDFYGLQKGDNFKVIYEEVFVDNVMVGIGRIEAAVFQTNGKDFYAYNFEQEGKTQYFDETGQSLQRSFLKAPLKFSHISSRFSKSRMHPILRIARPHFGVDYAAPRGTPVVALGDGHVVVAGFHGGYGRFISIRHNSVYTTTYAHLSGYAKGIKPGSHVQQGQLIGYVGMSGLATGPHLDFRVYRNGQPVDPLKLESPPSKPVDPKDLAVFKQMVSRMHTELAGK